MGMVFLATLLVVALVAFLGFQRSMFLKAGAVAHSIATVTLFVVMTQIMPGTVALTFRDIAPIIAALLSLTNTVVVLLLWHQLQKRDKLNA